MNTLKTLKYVIGSLLFVSITTAQAQDKEALPPKNFSPPPHHQGMPPQPPPPRPPFGGLLFPPELILSNQERLSLTEEQKTKMSKEMEKSKTEFTDLQKKMEEEKNNLEKLLSKTPINEESAVSQEEKMFSVEKKIKSLHLKLLIRIKNILKPEQIDKLKELIRPPQHGA